ncbi:MAG TPA: type II secretion system protein [Luteolibacter sp.]
MKSIQRHGKAAFTLIELMAVIAIMVILAALVMGGLGYVQDKRASSQAKVQMGLISKALEEYKLDRGLEKVAPYAGGGGQLGRERPKASMVSHPS